MWWKKHETHDGIISCFYEAEIDVRKKQVQRKFTRALWHFFYVWWLAHWILFICGCDRNHIFTRYSTEWSATMPSFPCVCVFLFWYNSVIVSFDWNNRTNCFENEIRPLILLIYAFWRRLCGIFRTLFVVVVVVPIDLYYTCKMLGFFLSRLYHLFGIFFCCLSSTQLNYCWKS